MLYFHRFMSNTNWKDLKPAVLIFFAGMLSIMGLFSPFIATWFPEANVLIGFTGGISLITSIKLFFEFKKSN